MFMFRLLGIVRGLPRGRVSTAAPTADAMEVEDPYDPPESQPARPSPARTVLSRVGIPGRKRTQGKFQVNLANAGIRSNLAERQAARARLPVTQPAMLQKQKEEQEREKRKRMADDTWAKRQEELGTYSCIWVLVRISTPTRPVRQEL